MQSVQREVGELLRECSRAEAALWAAACAERVSDLFTQSCPDDERPRKAIKAARAWSRGDISMADARKAAFAAHSAAREAGEAAATAAARAAGHAAATAHVVTHAPHAADYAAKAYAIAYGNASAACEREWQLTRLQGIVMVKEHENEHI